MKIYICKICIRRGKSFNGIRPSVRKHLREEHLIKGINRSRGGEHIESDLTKNTLAEEI